VILLASKLLLNEKGEMKICEANGMVAEVLVTSGFNHLIQQHDTELEALAAFIGKDR
jgi:anti-anti-sigma regulatory factor